MRWCRNARYSKRMLIDHATSTLIQSSGKLSNRYYTAFDYTCFVKSFRKSLVINKSPSDWAQGMKAESIQLIVPDAQVQALHNVSLSAHSS